MRTLYYFLGLSLVFISCGTKKLDKSLLWRISGDNIKTSYVYGTIHAQCKNELPDKVNKALNETNNVHLELDMDDPELQMKMMSHVMMEDGKTIQTMISQEDYKILGDFLKKETGYDISMFNSMKPMMLSSMLIPKMLDCPMVSVESLLMENAKSNDENVLGLETIQDQFNAFDQVPEKEQIDEFVRSAKDGIDNSKSEFQNLMTEYENEDIEKLLELTQKDDNSFKKHADVLLYDRNRNWIPKIIQACEKEESFFGVGAGHLAGDQGLIQLLRKQGFDVEPVF